MIKETPTLVVVSAFGSGHWLAAEAKATINCDVHMIDVSDAMGRWAPEDGEGPFGLFQTESMSKSQNLRLSEEDQSEAVSDGFSVWTKNGPINTRGSHSEYLLNKSTLTSDSLEYLKNYSTDGFKKRKARVLAMQEQSFQNTWLSQLAHSIAACEYNENTQAVQSGEPLPIFSPHYLRRVSRKGFERSLDWVKNHGVQVYAKATMRDISIDGSTVQSIEVLSERSGVINCDQVVWCLNACETARLGLQFHESLYNGPLVPPEWIWIRARMTFGAGELKASLPNKFVLVYDMDLPWTHANLQMIQKTHLDDQYDVWVRIPNMHRFQKTYIAEIYEEVCRIIKSKLPGSEPKMQDEPQDYLYSEEILGPARFQVYDKKSRSRIKRKNLINLQHDSSDIWSNHDWSCRFAHQMNVLNHIKSWKTEYDNKIEKLKAKERGRQ